MSKIDKVLKGKKKRLTTLQMIRSISALERRLKIVETRSKKTKSKLKSLQCERSRMTIHLRTEEADLPVPYATDRFKNVNEEAEAIEAKKNVRPFSCGTQDIDWQDRNCCRCARLPDGFWEQYWKMESGCEIFDALSFAAVDDGTITEEIAERMGYVGGPPFDYTWDCKERILEKSRPNP